MASPGVDLELGTSGGGESEKENWKSIKPDEENVSDMKLNVVSEDGTPGVDVSKANALQFRLRRAVSDVKFRAKLAPVLPGKKVRLSAYAGFEIT